jgi:hypothetical protein
MEGREQMSFVVKGRRDALVYVSGWKDAGHFCLSAEQEYCTRSQFARAVHTEVPGRPGEITAEDGCWVIRGGAAQ